MKESHDRRSRPSVEYQPGDLVYLEATNIKTTRPSKKLGAKRFGPFKIVKKVGRAAYELKLPDQWPGLRPVYNESYLTLHKRSRFPNQQKPGPPPPIEIEGEKEYVVEEIRGRRTRTRRGRPDRVEYLVHWKGYPDEEDTWEPVENLGNANDAIEEFLDNEGTPTVRIGRISITRHIANRTSTLRAEHPERYAELYDDLDEDCRPRMYPTPTPVDALIPLSPEIVDSIQENPWYSSLELPELPSQIRRVWIYETAPVEAITTLIRYDEHNMPVRLYQSLNPLTRKEMKGRLGLRPPERPQHAPLSILFSQQPVMQKIWQDSERS